MYNKYIAIITAENKERYISATINSCLKQEINNKLKIIVVYSNLKNEKTIKYKFKKYKNIIFLKLLKKKKFPTQDQLYKIHCATKYINNEWIMLLDGDDKFKSKKIKFLSRLSLKKNQLYLHNHEIIHKNIMINYSNKFYKKFLIYKKLFNDWPEKVNTSSILIPGNLLKNFYKKSKPYNWKYLAIDIQLVLFYFYKNKFKYIDEVLTEKVENINNLDKKFSNYIKKIYWIRRMEQHKLTRSLSGKMNYLDRFISLFFQKIFK